MKFKIGDVVECHLPSWSHDILGVIEDINTSSYPFIVRYQDDNGTHSTLVVLEKEMTLVK